MPIKRNDFEKGNFKSRYNIQEKHPVYLILLKDKGLAFTVKEIARRTGFNTNTIRSMLRKLIKSGLVDHKAPYFALKVSKKRR